MSIYYALSRLYAYERIHDGYLLEVLLRNRMTNIVMPEHGSARVFIGSELG